MNGHCHSLKTSLASSSDAPSTSGALYSAKRMDHNDGSFFKHIPNAPMVIVQEDETGGKKAPPLRKQRVQWTAKEDAILREIVPKKIYPHERIWTGMAAKINERSKHTIRTPKDCRERWQNVLDPKLTKSIWTTDELEIIEKIYSACGPKWAVMTQILKGRSERDIKNIWNSKQRQSKLTKSGFRTISKGPIVGARPPMDESALREPLGTKPSFPPDFSLHPIMQPKALETPLTLPKVDIDAAETLSRSLVNVALSRDIERSTAQLTSIDPNARPDETAGYRSDAFKALDSFYEILK